MPSPRLITVALLALYGAASFSLGARAEPLDRDECKTLKEEQKSLLTKEVRAALARGPDWVKDHLQTPGDIEKVRQYLLIEEKVEFRCRTDGVRIPKPEPPPPPDPKPPVPLFTAEGQKVLAGVAAISFLPLRKPSLSAPEPVQAEAAAEQGVGDADDEVATSADTKEKEEKPGSSHTVADSDKTASPKTKATQ